jgi:hypothetical protein
MQMKNGALRSGYLPKCFLKSFRKGANLFGQARAKAATFGRSARAWRNSVFSNRELCVVRMIGRLRLPISPRFILRRKPA